MIPPEARSEIDRANAVGLANPLALLEWVQPGGRQEGPEYVCASASGGAGRSCSTSIAKLVGGDFASDGDRWNDPVSLVAKAFGLPMRQAARHILERFGTSAPVGPIRQKPKAKPADTWTPILPVPDDAPAPGFRHPRLGDPVAHWTYRDAEGRVLGYDCRYEPEGERKQVLPYTFCQNSTGKCSWEFKSFPDPRPLYGLDRLAKAPTDAFALWGEGAKTADAAQRLLPGMACMTSPGGSSAVGKVNLNPLKGRKVLVWPDADEPGRKAAKVLASRLKQAGAEEVFVIDPPEGVSEGWDLADAEAEGWDTARTMAHIQAHRQRQEAAPDRAFRFLPLSALLSAPRPTRWLIRDHLEAESLAELFGDSGSMKTFLAIDQGLCIATGTPWHGHAVPNPGAVFYLAGEGFHGLSKRVQAWTVAHGADPATIPFFVSNAPAQLLDSDGVADVAGAVAALAEEHGPPKLVIVDTLNRNFGPGDENNSQDMTRFVAALDALKARFGCAILVVHHSGLANKDRSRGSSVLRAALDFEYRLTVKGNVRVLSCTKSKDHEPPQDMAFKPEEIGTGWTDPETLREITSVVLRETEAPIEETGQEPTGAKRIALEALTEAYAERGGPVPLSEWRQAAYARGISKAGGRAQIKAFSRAMKDLTDENLIHCDDDSCAPVPSGHGGHRVDMSTLSRGHGGGHSGHTPLGVSTCLPACPPDRWEGPGEVLI